MSYLESEKIVFINNERLLNSGKNELEEWLSGCLYNAFYEARKNKLNTINEQLFEVHREQELINLTRDIINRVYTPSSSVAFIITEPTPREIFAAPFRDRVVHHFLIQQNGDFWNKRLSHRSFSCRQGKGTLYGINCLKKDIINVSRQYTEDAWVMKIDLQGYFMSLSRKYLFERVCWGLDRQFPLKGPIYEVCKYLWYETIFDNPIDNVKIKGAPDDWDILPLSKSMFNSKPGHGIVIGNLTSQWLSNMALDTFDRFVVHDLGIKQYGRYVDDAYFVARTKEELLYVRPLIEDYIKKLGLVVHPKKFYLQSVHRGVSFLGVVIYPGRVVLGRRFCKNMRILKSKIEEDGLSVANIESVRAYSGLAKHFNYKKTMNKNIGKNNLKNVRKWYSSVS